MERAGKLIGKLKLPEGSITNEALACAAWPGAVGRKIAVHTHAARMVRSTLIIEVEDAVWQRQLFFLRHDIRKKIDDTIGAGIVEDVEFRVSPPRLGPQRALRSTPQPDEADGIVDPVLRRIYKTARKKGLA
jgi:hypothetical protein